MNDFILILPHSGFLFSILHSRNGNFVAQQLLNIKTYEIMMKYIFETQLLNFILFFLLV